MEKKEKAQMNELIPYMEAVEKLSRPEKVGQLFMPAAFINDTEKSIRQIEELIKKYSIGGLCFFHSRASAATNFEGKKKIPFNADSLGTMKALIRRYQRCSQFPLLIAIDAEWGLAMRIENTPRFPYALTLGAIQDKENLIFEVGRHIGYDCRQAGVHWNFAPVADINQNPLNPVIGYRSFGESPEVVSRKAGAMMRGIQQQGILTAAKHFPGHGDTATDSHLGLPLIDKDRETLFNQELIPFRELINAGADAVMVGHLAVPALTRGISVPASVSPEIITGLLREELGFGGAVVSDALNMHSVSRLFPAKGQLEWEAFLSGNDVLCFAEHIAEGIEIIASKATDVQLEASFQRVWELKQKAFNNTIPVTDTPVAYHELMGEIAVQSLTEVSGNAEVIAGFRNGSFTVMEVAGLMGQPFVKNIEMLAGCRESLHLDTDATTFGTMAPGQKIVLAIYPRSAKPSSSFGMGKALLDYLNGLFREHDVILYLFGNPYFLNLLDTGKAKAVVVAYQEFAEFQEVAVRHFEGRQDILGKLPVTLKASKK
jgi:beta-glucosidase-like glycosyl hydrolase